MRIATMMWASGSDGFPQFGLIVLGVSVGIAILVFSFIAAAKRRKELSEFALLNGLSFTAHPGAHHSDYEAFVPFGQGHSRKSRNLVHGQRGAFGWEMFDYQYTVGSGKNQQTHHYGIVLAKVDVVFSTLRIRPEGFFDKLAAAVGFDDIDFESEAFSKRFHVSSADRKFAYDLIHPQMMEFLLARPGCDWQLGGRIVMITRSRLYGADDLLRMMTLIEGFVERIPEYVRQDRGAK